MRSSPTLSSGVLPAAVVADSNILLSTAGYSIGDMTRLVASAIRAWKVSLETNARIDDNLRLPALVVPALRNALGDRLRSIVLFGSRARGDHRPESDWDLLVIAELLPARPLDRYREIKSALPPGTRGVTAVLAATPEEFDGASPKSISISRWTARSSGIWPGTQRGG